MIWLALVAGIALGFVGAIGYLVWYLRWEARQTRGMAYYGQQLPQRQALNAHPLVIPQSARA